MSSSTEQAAVTPGGHAHAVGRAGPPSRIAIVGDSIVLGRIDPQALGWVARATPGFIAADPSTRMLFNLGIGGDTIRHVAKRIVPECHARNVDAVVLAVGINDSRRLAGAGEANLVPLENFACEYAAVLDALLERWRHVGCVTTFPIDEARAVRQEGHRYLEVDRRRYDAAIAVCARDRGMPVLDLDQVVAATGVSVLDFSYDGVHPNARGHELIAAAALPWLLALAVH